MAGWVDNWNGPTGLVSAVGKGLFRTMLCEANYVADMVPVDIVINLMIAAAWRTATAKPDSLLIYNCCTGQQKPITWGQFVELAINKTRLHPLGEMVFSFYFHCCKLPCLYGPSLQLIYLLLPLLRGMSVVPNRNIANE